MEITYEVVTDTRIGPAPAVEQFAGGWRIAETWMFDSSDERAVVFSPNFPKRGDPINDERFENMVVVSSKTRYFRGKDSDDGTRRGRVLVDVVWETPGLNGTLPPPFPGSRFTRFLPGTTSQTVYAAINPDGTPVDPAEAIAGGQGVERLVGTLVFQVHRYEDKETFNPNTLLQLMTYLASDQRVNHAQINLPPLLGSGAQIELAKGQARYVSGTMDDNQGVVEIVHEIAVAKDHLARWRDENAAGEFIGPVKTARIYPDGQFFGLW